MPPSPLPPPLPLPLLCVPILGRVQADAAAAADSLDSVQAEAERRDAAGVRRKRSFKRRLGSAETAARRGQEMPDIRPSGRDAEPSKGHRKQQRALEKERKREESAAARAERREKQRQAELDRMEVFVAPERPPSPAAKGVPMVPVAKVSAKDRWKKAAAKMSAMARLSLPITRNIPGVPEKPEGRRGVGLFKGGGAAAEPKRSKLYDALNPQPLHHVTAAEREERETETASGFGARPAELLGRDDSGALQVPDESEEEDVDPGAIPPLEELAPGLKEKREQRAAEEQARRAALKASYAAVKAAEEAELAKQRAAIMKREQERKAAAAAAEEEEEVVTGFGGMIDVDVGEFRF